MCLLDTFPGVEGYVKHYHEHEFLFLFHNDIPTIQFDIYIF